MVWDRWFGTFEPERAPVTYGLTTQIGTTRWLDVQLFEIRRLRDRLRRAGSWSERLGVLAIPRRRRRRSPRRPWPAGAGSSRSPSHRVPPATTGIEPRGGVAPFRRRLHDGPTRPRAPAEQAQPMDPTALRKSRLRDPVDDGIPTSSSIAGDVDGFAVVLMLGSTDVTNGLARRALSGGPPSEQVVELARLRLGATSDSPTRRSPTRSWFALCQPSVARTRTRACSRSGRPDQAIRAAIHSARSLPSPRSVCPSPCTTHRDEVVRTESYSAAIRRFFDRPAATAGGIEVSVASTRIAAAVAKIVPHGVDASGTTPMVCANRCHT